MSKYVLGSHNSWSYLPPKHWWMRPFRFMARCQRVDLVTQYEMGVRCFDLRVLVDGNHNVKVAHGMMVYDIEYTTLLSHLRWLDSKGDCYVRVIHEVRRKSQYTTEAVLSFCLLCLDLRESFRNVYFWCGRNLYNWDVDFFFNPEPTCEERHASVSKPRLVDDWWPWLYARLRNDAIRMVGTDREILLIDFVDIG